MDEWKHEHPGETTTVNLKNVHKNSDRMLAARLSIEQKQEKLTRLQNEYSKADKSKRPSLKISVKNVRIKVEGDLTELKKAQDAVRKSLDVARKGFAKVKENEIQSASYVSMPDLSNDAVSSLVKSAKNDD